MLGTLLSSAIKIATLPIDAANATMDVAVGGDGSKQSRNSNPTPLSFAESVRDAVAETAKEIDE